MSTAAAGYWVETTGCRMAVMHVSGTWFETCRGPDVTARVTAACIHEHAGTIDVCSVHEQRLDRPTACIDCYLADGHVCAVVFRRADPVSRKHETGG